MVDTSITGFKTASLIVGSAIFFIVMLYVGSRTEDWIESASDFLVSGREINALVIASGLAAIGLAGSVVSAVPEFTVAWGIIPTSMYILGWCVMIAVFGWFLGPIIRRTGVYTTSEWMEQRFDRKTRVVTAIASTIGIIGVVSAQFVGMGAILASITQLPFWQMSFVVLLVTLVYMYLGGLWAVTITDAIQVVIGTIAIVLLTGWLVFTYGDFGWLAANIQSPIFSFWGTDAIEPISLQFNSPLTWLFGWGALVIGNQYYWIRVVSARSERAAKIGPALGGIIVAVFFTVLLALPGAYALAVFGSPTEAGYSARGIIGVFITQMPVGLDAFVLVALIAAVMSTASTAIIGITAILIRDVWEPLRGEAATAEELVSPSRIFTLVVGFGGWLWAATWQESAGLMLALGWSFIAPLVPIIILGLFWKRTTSAGAFLGILCGIVGVLIWQYAPLEPVLTTFGHATWIGLGLPVVVAVVVSLATPPPYYGKTTWTAPKAAETESGTGVADGDVSRAEAVDEHMVDIVCELAKPWTPSTRWNEYVETRGRKKGGIIPTILGRTTEPTDGGDQE